MRPFRIIHTEPSMELGGQEFRVLNEAKEMRARGHTVALVTRPGSELHTYAVKAGVCVELVEMRNMRWIPLISDFGTLIQKHQADVVNTHGSIDSWTASIAGRVSKQKPFIIRTRHKSTPISNTWRHRILYQKLPHVVVTTGQAVRQQMICQNGCDESKIVSIPTGVDLDLYRPQPPDLELKHQLGFGVNDLVVGTISFLRDYKGIEIFLEAAKLTLRKIPHVRFLIVGNGPEQERCVQTIEQLELHDRVLLTGFREDIPRILSILDVFVLASIGGEGVPQALTQALAMERAVVATSIGGIPEVIQDQKTGMLISPGNPQALAEKMYFLLQNPTYSATLGEAGRLLVANHYSLGAMLDRTECLYRQWREKRGGTRC